MDGTVCEIIERLVHGGGQPVQDIGLQEDGGGFETDGKDRGLIPKIGTQPFDSGGTIGCREIIGQILVKEGIRPTTVIQGSTCAQQVREIPVGGEFNLSVIEIKLAGRQCRSVFSPWEDADCHGNSEVRERFSDLLCGGNLKTVFLVDEQAQGAVCGEAGFGRCGNEIRRRVGRFQFDRIQRRVRRNRELCGGGMTGENALTR
jgi:hypothetical protein